MFEAFLRNYYFVFWLDSKLILYAALSVCVCLWGGVLSGHKAEIPYMRDYHEDTAKIRIDADMAN
jgi:hypothetical protein